VGRVSMLEPRSSGPFEVPTLEHDLVVLPQRIEGDVGIYRDETLMIKKELLAEDVDVDYLHDAEHRQWHGLKGQELLLQIAIGIASSGAVAALQSWLTRRWSGKRVQIKVVRKRRKSDGAIQLDWYEAEGDGESIAAALEAIRDDDVTRT